MARTGHFSVGFDRAMREVVIYFRGAEWKCVAVGEIEREFAEVFLNA